MTPKIVYRPRRKWHQTDAAQFLFALMFLILLGFLGLAYMVAFPDAPTGTAVSVPDAQAIRTMP